MLWLKIRKLMGLISSQRYGDMVLNAKVMQSGLFDKKWYLKTYPDVADAKVNPVHHYLTYGWREGRNPSPRFDNNAYLVDNPDVMAANMCPLLHYINHGRTEGRYIRNVSGIKQVKLSLKQRLVYVFRYPIRVHEEYMSLKDEINRLNNGK